jgi:hypothetical protein
MKIAQQFIAGLGSERCARPARDDRNHLFSVKQRNFHLSSLTGRVISKNANPALKCWATFIASLRDASSHESLISPVNNHRLCQSTTADNRPDASGRRLIVYTRQLDRALKPSCWLKVLPAVRLREPETAAHEKREFQTGRGRLVSR